MISLREDTKIGYGNNMDNQRKGSKRPYRHNKTMKASAEGNKDIEGRSGAKINGAKATEVNYNTKRGETMFREMRRKKQLLSKDETIEILSAHTSGVLGVNGDDGYPYTVPVSYIYKDNKLFFHCAKEGHKIDSIKKDDKVTFCVIDKDDVVQEAFTTHFRSVIVFGRARIPDGRQ